MILVFGGSGQLGRELVLSARMQGIDLEALPHTWCDVADESAVAVAVSSNGPQVVINAAAYTKVDLAEKDIEAAERGNTRGPHVLAKCCAAANVPLIHISTDYVFDGSKSAPYVESDPVAPINVYGVTKAKGEAAIRSTSVRHVIIRTAWVYSAFGSNFMKTVLRLTAERDELRIVADQHGCPTSARNLADALLHIAPRLAHGDSIWGTYHFAGLGVTTWYGFAEKIIAAQAQLTGRRPKLVPISTADYPTPARRPKNSAFDCELFMHTFGLAPKRWQEETDAIVPEVLAEMNGKETSLA